MKRLFMTLAVCLFVSTAAFAQWTNNQTTFSYQDVTANLSNQWNTLIEVKVNPQMGTLWNQFSIYPHLVQATVYYNVNTPSGMVVNQQVGYSPVNGVDKPVDIYVLLPKDANVTRMIVCSFTTIGVQTVSSAAPGTLY